MPGSARTAVWLAQAVASALDAVGWAPASVELVGVTQGPGSFTGLRMGVTTAKMLAFAWQTPVVPMDTLWVIANQVEGHGRVRVAMDAQRNELFTATFEADASTTSAVAPRWRVAVETRVVAAADWLTEEEDAMLTGPGLERLVEQIPANRPVADRSRWYPSATTVAKLASAEFAAGRHVTPTELTVHYHRKSYAERN